MHRAVPDAEIDRLAEMREHIPNACARVTTMGETDVSGDTVRSDRELALACELMEDGRRRVLEGE